MPKNTQAVPSAVPAKQKQAVPSAAKPQAQSQPAAKPQTQSSPADAMQQQLERQAAANPTPQPSSAQPKAIPQTAQQQATPQQAAPQPQAADINSALTEAQQENSVGNRPSVVGGAGNPGATMTTIDGSSGTPSAPETPTAPRTRPEDLPGHQRDEEDPTDTGPGGGTGTTTPTETKPEVDTGATTEDPYSTTIDEYGEKVEGIISTLSSLTDEQIEAYAASTGQTIEEAKKKIADILAGLQDSAPDGKAGRMDHVDTTEEERLLEEIKAAQEEQAKTQIDYAVQTGVDELTRAQEDAQSQFQTMRDQIAASERQALDNQALYAEARGDKGGIGQAQYGSIQNTAATNQLTVNREQTKLATDTARQIADLRAQGEFKKADQLLSITQNYLAKLMELKQWADATNVSIDEFNIGVDKWEQEFQWNVQQVLAGMNLSAEQWATGLDLDRDKTRLDAELSAAQREADMSTTLATTLAGMQLDATTRREEKAAKAAAEMIATGVQPTDEQLAAIGWSKDQYDAYKTLQEKAQAGASAGGSKGAYFSEFQNLLRAGTPVSDLNTYITRMWSAGYISAGEKDEMETALETALGRDYESTVYEG